MRLMDGQYRLL